MAEEFDSTTVELALVLMHLYFTTTELVSTNAVLIRRSTMQGFFRLIQHVVARFGSSEGQSNCGGGQCDSNKGQIDSEC